MTSVNSRVYMRTSGFKSPGHPNLNPNVDTNNDLETSPTKKPNFSFRNPTTVKWNQNRRKTVQKRIMDPNVSFLLLPCCPRVAPRCQNCFPGYQMEASADSRGRSSYDLSHLDQRTQGVLNTKANPLHNPPPPPNCPSQLAIPRASKSDTWY